MTDATLRALLATEEIARDPSDWRRYANQPYTYGARTCIRPAPNARAGETAAI